MTYYHLGNIPGVNFDDSNSVRTFKPLEHDATYFGKVVPIHNSNSTFYVCWLGRGPDKIEVGNNWVLGI